MHIRAFSRDEAAVSANHVAAFVPEQAALDDDARAAKLAQPATADDLVGILASDDRSTNARANQRIGARRRAALVSVRLERHVRGGASRLRSGRRQRHGFGMRTAGAPVVTTGDLTAVADEDATDGGIRSRPSEAALGFGDGFAHPFLVDSCSDAASVAGGKLFVCAGRDVLLAGASGRSARIHSLPPRFRSLTRFSTVRWNSAMSRNER